MAIRPVLKMGEPLLLQTAEAVLEFDTEALHDLIQDMRDTMADLSGAGLAAPQIGVSLQVMIFGSSNNLRYPDEAAVPETILINPILTPLDHAMEEGWEGCLSVPGMRGLVPRYTQVRYQGFDLKGEKIDRTVSGFHARVVQHEYDHLVGVLYPMRIRDMRYFGFTEVLFAGQELAD